MDLHYNKDLFTLCIYLKKIQTILKKLITQNVLLAFTSIIYYEQFQYKVIFS